MNRSLVFPFLRGVVLLGGWWAATTGVVRAETLTLADCLRETAAHNPDIIAQQYAVQQAAGTRLTLRARALPTIFVSGILGYEGERSAETFAHNLSIQRDSTELIIGTGEIDQSIFDAAIPASWRRGNLTVTVAQENLYTVAVARLNLTQTLFYTALFQQETGAVLHQLDDVLASGIKTLGQLATAGLAGRQGLLAAQVQRTNFATSVIATNGSFQTGLTTLLLNMGRDLGPAGAPGSSRTAGVRLGGLLEERAISFNASDAAREALAYRPDIHLLRDTVRALTEDANITRGGYYPLVRVYVAGELIPQNFVQTANNSVRQSDETQTSEVRPGVREDWTVIDTGAIRGTVRAQEAQRDAVTIALQQAERNVPSDLVRVRAQMTDAANKITALRNNVGTAENTLNLIQTNLAQGIASQFEALDAENGVLGARAGLLAAELEMSLAHADFDRITGRYLRFIPQGSATASHHDPARK